MTDDPWPQTLAFADKFARRYREDATFRADFNQYLRGLGVRVEPDEPPRTLKDICSEYPTTH